MEIKKGNIIISTEELIELQVAFGNKTNDVETDDHKAYYQGISDAFRILANCADFNASVAKEYLDTLTRRRR